MRDKVEKFITEHGMLENVKNVVAGVSGGADSMCMLHILNQMRERYGYHLCVVHIHHGIRGKDADEDLAYVEKCCREWKIEFRAFRYQVEELAEEWHMSCEEAGRKVRYDAFREVLEELGGGKIAVAHNSNDVSETFLFHLFRGTGIKGLVGIRPVRGEVIRPVLCLDRHEILEYLEENGINYKTDVTNEEELYTRNKIRNRLLPFVEGEINKNAGRHIFQAASAMDEIEQYMEKQADKAYLTVVETNGNGYALNIDSLRSCDKVIQKMLFRKVIGNLAGKLKDITSVHIDMIMEIAEGETGRKARLPYGIICEKQYRLLRIYVEDVGEKQEIEEYAVEFSLKETEQTMDIHLPEKRGRIRLEITENRKRNWENEEKIYTKWLDYGILTSTFQIRNRRPGDYIVVNEQGGRKKIKDYFIDLKIPREERNRVLLLARDSEIFWIIGYRLSEHCKVREGTENVVKIEYFPQEEIL